MIKYLINQTAFNTTSTTHFIRTYVTNLPNLIKAGDFTAMAVATILFLVSLIIINKITTAMMKVIESFLILTIISYASYLFINVFSTKFHAEGMTLSNLFVLAIGGLSIAAGLFSGVMTLLKHTKKYDKIDEEIEKINDEPIKLNFKELASDQSIGKRIIYLVISEFGVFSSKTISAPNPKVGIAIFLIFVFGATAYIMTMKNKYKEMKFFIITLAFGIFVAVTLSLTWSSMPLKEIMSINFFDSDALVAVITGTAISLYMGGK